MMYCYSSFQAAKASEVRRKHTATAVEELKKFGEEAEKFEAWLKSAETELKKQARKSQDLDNIKADSQKHKVSNEH